MKSIKAMIADSIAKIIISSMKRKSTILKEVIDNPNNVKIEASIEDGEITVKIKKKESTKTPSFSFAKIARYIMRKQKEE